MNEPRARTRLLFCVLGSFALLFLILVVRMRLQTLSDAVFVSDAFGYYMYLPSVFIDGDLDLRNQIGRQPGQENHLFYQPVPATGLCGNAFQVGCAVLWTPVFLATHAVIRSLGGLGLPVSTDGFGLAYEVPVFVGAFLWGWWGVWYIWRLLKELWGAEVARFTTLAIVLAPPLAAYLWVDAGMSHAASMTLIAMLVYYLYDAWRREDLHWTSWLRIGLLCGLVVATRATDVFVGILVGYVGLHVAVRTWRSQTPAGAMPSIGLAVASLVAAALIGFLPQMLVWKTIYGGFLVLPQGTNYSDQSWLAPDVWRYLLSTYHGTFAWSPLLFVAALGLLEGIRRKEPFLVASLLVLAVAIYFTSSTPQWWTGCSFGERRMVDYSVVFALGLGYLFHSRPQLLRSRWCLGLLLLLIVFNWGLMARYFAHDLPEYGYVSWWDLYVGTMTYPWRMTMRILGGRFAMGWPGGDVWLGAMDG